MGPVSVVNSGPPWSVQIIIQTANGSTGWGMQCLVNPLVPLAELPQTCVRQGLQIM
jgi:hypothetical protein